MFRNDQRQFYKELDGKMNGQTEAPDPKGSIEFWIKLLSEPVEHNTDIKESYKDNCTQVFRKVDTEWIFEEKRQEKESGAGTKNQFNKSKDRQTNSFFQM